MLSAYTQWTESHKAREPQEHSIMNWARKRQKKNTSCKEGRDNINNDFVFMYETFSLNKLWIRSDEVVVCFLKKKSN